MILPRAWNVGKKIVLRRFVKFLLKDYGFDAYTNAINLEREYYQDFSCEFDLYYYPFDTQVNNYYYFKKPFSIHY